MIGSPDELSDTPIYSDEEDQLRRGGIARIAAPGATTGLPPVTARGLGPVTPAASPAAGSTEDLEARGSASRIAPLPIARPSALDTRKTADEAELGRLQSTGSGISQIKNPFARNALRGLETIGNVLVPRTTAMIPGTEGHHNQLLGQARGRIGEDLNEEEKTAQTAKAGADTDEAAARAEKARADAAAAGQPKPKEEKWSPFAGFTDTDGTPLIHEENSGQVVRASDHKPATGFKAIAPKNDKPDTAEQQMIDAEAAVNGATDPVAKAAAQKKLDDLKRAISDYQKTTQKPEQPLRTLLVVPGPNGTQKVIEATPGMTIAGNAEKPGAGAAATRTDIREHDKDYVLPADGVEKSYQMMNNAFNEYQAAKAQGKDLPTGAQSMVALSTHLSTTFGNVKGARITKDMIQEHLGSRSVSDSALVAIQKLTNGDVLSPDQWKAFHDLISESRKISWQTAAKEADRKHIPVDFLPSDLKDVAHEPGATEHAEPERPANVPANYVYKANGPKGEGWYKP